MKKLFFLAVLPLCFLFSCEEENTETVMIDSSQPSGTFTVQRSGAFVEQNGTGTMGTAELGIDADGEQFIRFGQNFQTNLGTGTVTIFLSTSEEFMADPGNGNPNLRLIGNVSMNGETFYRIIPSAEGRYTHIILWCASASIPFGYAPLQ